MICSTRLLGSDVSSNFASSRAKCAFLLPLTSSPRADSVWTPEKTVPIRRGKIPVEFSPSRSKSIVTTACSFFYEGHRQVLQAWVITRAEIQGKIGIDFFLCEPGSPVSRFSLGLGGLFQPLEFRNTARGRLLRDSTGFRNRSAGGTDKGEGKAAYQCSDQPGGFTG